MAFSVYLENKINFFYILESIRFASSAAAPAVVDRSTVEPMNVSVRRKLRFVHGRACKTKILFSNRTGKREGSCNHFFFSKTNNRVKNGP